LLTRELFSGNLVLTTDWLNLDVQGMRQTNSTLPFQAVGERTFIDELSWHRPTRVAGFRIGDQRDGGTDAPNRCIERRQRRCEYSELDNHRHKGTCCATGEQLRTCPPARVQPPGATVYASLVRIGEIRNKNFF
jgi:hypothetical protein